MLLSMDKVRASFHTPDGMVQAVDEVSLELRQGEILGLIGETGSGKSVLGLSIPGLLPVEAMVSGSIWFKGRDLLKLDSNSLRKLRGSEIALIPQNPSTSLNPVMKIGNQIIESIRLHGNVERESFKERAIRLLRELHMPEPERKLSSYPFQFSGGMKQRVLAAIGAAGNPSLLIADEPTKGLDAWVRHQVVELLQRIARGTGAGLLVITHDLNAAYSLCDTIGVMYAGQIVEQGPVIELFTRPRHPYTIGLLASMPGRGMVPITGASPSPTEQVQGCKFFARCKDRMVECSAAKPDMYNPIPENKADREAESVNDRKVRCFLYAPGRRSAKEIQKRGMVE